MPYNSEKIPIAGTQHDQRCKLSPEQKSAIIILAGEGYSQRKLAAMFGCSKRSIQNILHPQARTAPKTRPKEYWTEAKRKYRARKQELYTNGTISKTRPSKRKP